MKKSKRLIASICLLLVAIIAATSTTFAWFALNNNATVDEFNLQVTKGTDALVIGVESYKTDATFKANKASVSDEVYTTLADKVKTLYSSDSEHTATTATLTLAEYKELTIANKSYCTISATAMKEVVYYNNLTLDIIAGSVDFVDKNVTLKYYDAAGKAQGDEGFDESSKYGKLSVELTHVTNDNGTLKTITNTEAAAYNYTGDALVAAEQNVDYLSFHLFFKSSSIANQGIYLYNESSVSALGTASEKVNAWEAINAGETKYGYSGEGNIAQGEELGIRAANAVRVGFGTTANNVTIANTWDPHKTDGLFNSNGDLSAGKQALSDAWLENLKGGEVNIGAGYDSGVVLANSKTAKDASATKIATVTAANTTDTFATGDVYVNIWLEGTDGECFNAIYNDSFNTALSFICIAD